MAKKIDPLKAKQKKQKKMAIGLSVALLAVLAYQGPKTLKLLKGPAAAPPAETTPTPVTSTTSSGAVPPGTPGAPAVVAGAPVPTAEAQPAVLIDSDVPVAASAGQLLSFERFDAVDPFDQQVDADAIPAAPQPSGSGAAAKAGAGETGGTATEKPAEGGKSGSVVPGAGAGTTGGASGPAPATAFTPPAPATTLTMNGAVLELTLAAEFPADDPVFVFVSAARDGKSIEIGIAGGAYANGAETITLKLGKPLTLQNTSDGSRYELELKTVQGFVPPKPKK